MLCGSSENRRIVLAGIWCLPWNPFSARFPVRSGGLSMKGPSIAAYAVRSVARNRRDTASALLGVVLAVGGISAPWIALDSTLRGLGDTLALEWQTAVFDPNATVIGYNVRWANFTISGFYQVVRPERGFPLLTAFLSVDDVPAVKAAANVTEYPLPGELFVWLDRE